MLDFMRILYSTIAIPASLPGPEDEASPPSVDALEKMEEPRDKTTSSFRESTARLARTLLVSLSHTPVDGHGKESGWSFTKMLFPNWC